MEGILALMIPLAPCIMVTAIVWISHRSKLEKARLEATANNSAEQAALRATNIQALEDRIRVLERIVTDRGYDVATQIEALRDTRNVEEGSGVPLAGSRRETAA